MKPKRLAISMGDPRGIGPEITLKALAAQLKVKDNWDYTIYGTPLLLEELNDKLGIGCPLNRVILEDASVFSWRLPALNAISWIEAAASACLSGKATGMVTAPISKEETIRAGYNNFTGQTEFLAAYSKTSHPVMMLLGSSPKGEWLRIALATTHLPFLRWRAPLQFSK
jgi:4-hydroxythreonine-4-phosphate dehydrogenase